MMVFLDFVKKVLTRFADDFMKEKPFYCSCGNDKNFIRKTISFERAEAVALR